jgi:hypothetical protein
MEWDLSFTSAISSELVHHAPSSGRLADDSDLLRISTEQVDVFLNPFKGKTLVKKTCIWDTSVFLEGWS